MREIPNFKYKPICQDVHCVAKRLEKGELDTDSEVKEFLYLRYFLQIQTVQLYKQINQLKCSEDIKDEMRDALLAVCSSDLPRDALVSLYPKVFTKEQLLQYIEFVTKIKKEYDIN